MRLDEAARQFVGVPFRHQGRDPAIGIDCIGLGRCASDLCGHPFALYDRTDYNDDPAHGLLESYFEAAAASGHIVEVSDLAPGDMALIDFYGAIRHFGIVGEKLDGSLTLIHTNASVKSVTEAGLNFKWRRRIKRVYRFVESSDVG